MSYCAQLVALNGTDTTLGGTVAFTTNPSPQYPLSVAVSGSGSGTVTGFGISCPGTCSLAYNSGASVSLTATAAPGSTFAGWSGVCAGTGACSMTISSDVSVTAPFTTSPPPPCTSNFNPPLPVSYKPTNTSLPTIKGKAKPKGKLTASQGTWTGTAPITYKYQWLVCAKTRYKKLIKVKCQAIKGATKTTFTISKKYAGGYLEVQVVASNSTGSAKATSKLVTVAKK